MKSPLVGSHQGRVGGRFGSYSSTCIGNISYEPIEGTLKITFSNPQIGTWEYYSVPPFEAAGLIESSSKGEYFNRNIKDKYSYERVR